MKGPRIPLAKNSQYSDVFPEDLSPDDECPTLESTRFFKTDDEKEDDNDSGESLPSIPAPYNEDIIEISSDEELEKSMLKIESEISLEMLESD